MVGPRALGLDIELHRRKTARQIAWLATAACIRGHVGEKRGDLFDEMDRGLCGPRSDVVLNTGTRRSCDGSIRTREGEGSTPQLSRGDHLGWSCEKKILMDVVRSTRGL
jgi:hypothetical protein